ncbi:isoleucyl tRNA synthetase [Culex quinquefasciatus]|uniref:Isoleucyl tRNA synthetase n=1 Tax=Culex quinquefasciatus TaxID=7176 RepID=B0X7Z8_CULQU|nr:isoleucyl tRNA synthetase [Culex quinquefasciatus]|eukprot:XP_001865770.1 isoleucyl tRNA synthetase [Culex quinquefasciatus]
MIFSSCPTSNACLTICVSNEQRSSHGFLLVSNEQRSSHGFLLVTNEQCSSHDFLLMSNEQRSSHDFLFVSNEQRSSHGSLLVTNEPRSSHGFLLVTNEQYSSHDFLLMSNEQRSSHDFLYVSNEQRSSHGRKAPAPIASPVAAKVKAPKESTKEKVLFVENLKRTINVQQLAAKFAPFGTVTAIRLVMDKETGRSKGFGNIQYVEAADAAKAMVQMNDLPGPNCTRLVLAADGQKMSKRKKNYPYPLEVHHKYGADELRLYLINSPVVRAENSQWQELDERDGRVDTSFKESLLEFVTKEMKAYHLYTIVPRLTKFIDQLTDWYVHMNRKRIKGEFGVEDNYHELDTLKTATGRTAAAKLGLRWSISIGGQVGVDNFGSNLVDPDPQSRLQLAERQLAILAYTLTEAKNDFKQVIKVVKVLTDPHIAKQLKLGFFTVLGHCIELISRPADLAETHHGDARFGQANAAIQLVPRVHRSDQNLWRNLHTRSFCGESMVVEMSLMVVMIGQYLLECHLAPIPLRTMKKKTSCSSGRRVVATFKRAQMEKVPNATVPNGLDQDQSRESSKTMTGHYILDLLRSFPADVNFLKLDDGFSNDCKEISFMIIDQT